jgi:tRNA (cytidine/uridine-2'-O-)-methyltransferase
VQISYFDFQLFNLSGFSYNISMSKPNINIVLINPQIPQNTGSIGRLCVGLDANLHIIRPMGFTITDRNVQRAGLDYWKHLKLFIHDDWDTFLKTENPQHIYFGSTKGTQLHTDCSYDDNCYLIFGSESNGLPEKLYTEYKDKLYQIPMPGEHARSLNLANSVAVMMYEAYRQIRKA